MHQHSRPSRRGILCEVFALVWSQADRYVKIRLATALLLVTGSSGFAALGPVVLKNIVDGIVPPRHTAFSIGALVTLYLLSQWLSRVSGEIRGVVYARAERRTCRTLSERLVAHVVRLPLRIHLERQTGAITQALASGLQGYQGVLHTLMFSVLPVAAELGTIVVVLVKLHQPLVLLLYTGAVICYGAVFIHAAGKTRKAAKNASATQIKVVGSIADVLLNYETVKYFTAETAVEERIGAVLRRAEEQWVDCAVQYAKNGILVAVIYTVFLGTTIRLAISEVEAGLISIGTFVLINSYMLQILRPVEMLGYAVQSLSQGIAYLDKMLELLREKTEPQIQPVATLPRSRHENGAHPPAARAPSRAAESEQRLSAPAVLEFKDVTFAYQPGRPILRGISFKIRAGTTLAIVGASGCGKSTLVRLATRMFEPTSGQILLDDVCIAEMSPQRVRESIGVVAQDVALFNDTIAYNIAFGSSEGTRADIEAAAELAHLHSFITALPEGYATHVGEGGKKMSGGERQRLSIARAAIKRPRIYMFDEATSALDSSTELEIVRNLREIARVSTTLIIAHRLSTVAHADEIAVLQDGVLVEKGSHRALLELNRAYARLWRTQQESSLAA